ncbi:btb/poz [Moelleriella libera RCEF 2490]|uniref:Btb/poz n=1 Tax=Moelleriella libera RCEF 2490 TaxID=1081109 RepID=A0A168EXV9_9HYPO|nr:btb/poz [Moelleriella libera RCEF 2490]
MTETTKTADRELVTARTLNLERYFPWGGFSDLTVVTKDNMDLQVHKIVLCSQSTVFENMIPFWEDHSDSKNSILKTDFNYAEVFSLMKFLYSGNYDDDEYILALTNYHPDCSLSVQSLRIDRHREVLLLHSKVSAIAMSVRIEPLAELAMERFRNALPKDHWDPIYSDVMLEAMMNTKHEGFQNMICEMLFDGPAEDGDARSTCQFGKFIAALRPFVQKNLARQSNPEGTEQEWPKLPIDEEIKDWSRVSAANDDEEEALFEGLAEEVTSWGEGTEEETSWGEGTEEETSFEEHDDDSSDWEMARKW